MCSSLICSFYWHSQERVEDFWVVSKREERGRNWREELVTESTLWLNKHSYLLLEPHKNMGFSYFCLGEAKEKSNALKAKRNKMMFSMLGRVALHIFKLEGSSASIFFCLQLCVFYYKIILYIPGDFILEMSGNLWVN